MGEEGRASRTKIVALTDALAHLQRADAQAGRRRGGRSGLNETDRSALRYISDLGRRGLEVTPGMLAARLHLSPSSITTLLDRLVAKGVIGVEPRPGDRRSKRVVAFASAPGADQPDQFTARLREISASLSSSDARLITAYLDRISESLQAQTRRRTH